MTIEVKDIYNSLEGIVTRRGAKIEVIDAERFRREVVDNLIKEAVFNESKEIRGHARWIIKGAALSLGITPASIQGFYEGIGRGEFGGITCPAINIRGLTYDVARAALRAAISQDVGALIFEIARSEIGYTDQHPSEYSTVLMAAAIKEGYKGLLFIQGDHFQVNASSFREDRERELASLKDLIKDSIASGFYNIDIDASTLVDLRKPDIVEQQRDNFEITAYLTGYIRDLEPEGITISIGGEIGEVGGKNSTVEELKAFMDNYLKVLSGMGRGIKGISKISVQTGTTHGGVVLPDGSIAKVKLDFDCLEKLSKVARERYKLAGCVQHGASTLPDDAFGIFPERSAVEIHLATGFQNMVYDSPHFPEGLKKEIYEYLKDNFRKEWKEGETEEQFIYKTRKKAFGPFKRQLWNLPEDVKASIRKELEGRFLFLFERLRVFNTTDSVRRWVKAVDVPVLLESEIRMA